MRYFVLTILFFIVSYKGLFGQNDFKMYVYTRTSDVIKKDCKKNIQTYKKDVRKCRLAQFELFCIGEYKQALAFSDFFQDPFFSFVDSLDNYSNAADYKPLSAHDFIIEKAADHQILIINEDHNQPRHRLFAKELLKDLFEQGFKYLAIEALGDDSTVNKDKVIPRAESLYLFDPQFSNFLKEALAVGFNLVSYEASKSELPNREYYQALHIKEKTLDKDKAAKLLIYCGFDHGCEINFKDTLNRMMGAWLKILTHIDPVTFDQITMTEHSSRDYEHTSYSFFKEMKSSIFKKNNSDSTYIPFDGRVGYDYYIYHPRTVYFHGRPNWLLSKGVEEYYVNVSNYKLKFPILISAYRNNEDPSNSIPIDIFELSSEKERKPLLLKSGSYKIILKDSSGKQEMIETFVK